MKDEMGLSVSDTLAVMTATASTSTMALADLLIGLRERVPLSEAQIARATGAGEQTVGAWLERRVAPTGRQAQRVAELAAFVEEMARNIEGRSLPGWLDGRVDVLDGANPLDEIAAGRYERMIQYALGASYGVFT
jgi:DNA-binding transcriptional regulator YiaG